MLSLFGAMDMASRAMQAQISDAELASYDR
jgi:hypothetical protein